MKFELMLSAILVNWKEKYAYTTPSITLVEDGKDVWECQIKLECHADGHGGDVVEGLIYDRNKLKECVYDNDLSFLNMYTGKPMARQTIADQIGEEKVEELKALMNKSNG